MNWKTLFGLLDEVRQDVRYAIRTLINTPDFTLAVVATLTLGIGANTAIFSVVNTVLLKPLQAPDAARLVRFMTGYGGTSTSITGAQAFDAWRRQTTLFENVSAHRLEFVNLTGGTAPEQIPIARVSAEFFQLFRAPLLHGRTFAADEDRPKGGAVTVLSYGIWTRRFASDATIIGRSISLGNVPYVVIGILGPQFETEQFEPRPEAWVPFQIDPERIDGGNLFQVTGRLKSGIIREMANAQLAVGAAAYRQRSVGTSQTSWFVESLQDAMVASIRPSLDLLLAAVFVVLLIACANVANLLLIRADARKREMATRIAIGAGRRRIVRQLLTESVVLSTAGGGLGFAAGTIGIRTLLTLYPGNNPFNLAESGGALPRIGDAGSAVTMDWRVLAFTVLISAVTGIVFGLVPALQAAGTDPYVTLKQSGGARGSGFGQNRGRALMVVSEIALALTLVIGAALLIRTSLALRSVRPGFDTHDVLTMRTAVTGTRFETRAGISDLTRNGIQRIRALPGVKFASTTCCVPLETVWQLPFVIESRPAEALTRSGNMSFHGFGGWTFVSPGYFDVFKIPILRGRDFSERDDASAPGVVIINGAMARRFWPTSDPLNDRLIIGRGMRPEYEQEPVRQIIGIVGDVRDTGLNRNPRPAMYVPVAQEPDGVTQLNVRLLPIVWIVRTSVEPHSIAPVVERELRGTSEGLPVARIRSMDEIVSESTARTTFDMWLMTIFAGSALLLALVGVYGLMAYSMQQRTHEIGIRLALGARWSAIRNVMVYQGLLLAGIGIVIGTIAAFNLSRLLAGFLFGVTARDPLVFTGAPALLIAAALLAVWIPARRASRIDPSTLLRHD